MDLNIKICESSECTACEACSQSCPASCIKMIEDENGFAYPQIDREKCLGCKKCVKVCPNNHKLAIGKSVFYMGWHRNLDVLKKSSSGGAFTAIADLILDQGGVVFGALFDKKDRKVKHIAIENKSELDKVRLSKYYQGTTKDCFEKVKICLKSRMVLFSGTACQIAGLYSYLATDYPNLVTVDVLCHGVASHKVVDEYIVSKEKQYKKKIVDFKFRLKPNDSDWQSGGGTRMKLIFDDGTSTIESKEKDTYFVGFNSYLFLRESCYNCKYTGVERIADFTLADYWGVPLDKIEDQQRKYGVSLILANSEKAQKMINFLEKDMVLKKIDSKNPIAHNQALEKPSTVNQYREVFFEKLGTKDFERLVYKYNRWYYVKVNVKEFLIKIIGEPAFNKIKIIIKRYISICRK